MKWKIDCLDWTESMKSLDDGSVDLVITDPPYSSLEKHRAVGTTTRLKNSKASSNDWFKTISNNEISHFIAEAYRVLKPNRHFYMMCDQTTFMWLCALYGSAYALEGDPSIWSWGGFRFWKAIVWDKQKIGMGYHYRAQHELILFLEKGKRKLNNLGTPDVLTYPRIHRGYPTEKPVELMEVLVKQSSYPGEVVFDPFCGSGPVPEAAIWNGRVALGSDSCAEAVAASTKRLEGK